MLTEQLINPKLTMLKVKVPHQKLEIKNNHITVNIHNEGYWIINGKIIKNKLTANWLYLLASLITNNSYTAINQQNGSESTNGNNVVHSPNSADTRGMSLIWEIMYGSSQTAPTISDYNLNTPEFLTNAVGAYEVESSSGAGIILYNQFMTLSQTTIYEIGLFFDIDLNGSNAILLSHLIFSNGLTIPANTWIQHGYQLFFPVPYTIWLVRSIFSNAFKVWEGPYSSGGLSNSYPYTIFTDITKTNFLPGNVAQINSWSLEIGTGTTPATPQDYALGSPLASLINQTSTVTINTSTNSGTIIFSGSYTPTANVTVGELGLYGVIQDQSGTKHTVLLIHVVFSTPISLTANTGYTFTINITA